MAFDKVVDSAELEAGMKVIADAIRAKAGTTAALEWYQAMADAITNIPTSGIELPTIAEDVLGTASDLAAGKQLIGTDGNIVAGAVSTVNEGESVGATFESLYCNKKDGVPTQIGIKGKFDTARLFRPGTYTAITAGISNFGNATPADVRSGVTFTSESGLKIKGEMEESVELPDIAEEELGAAFDLAEGKKLIAPDGTVVAGTVAVKTDGYYPDNYENVFNDGEFIAPVAIVEEDMLLRKGTEVSINIYKDDYGTAAPEDVRAGKTFTSKEGWCIHGNAVFPGEQYHWWTKYEDNSEIVETEKSSVVLSYHAPLSGDYYDYVQYADDVEIYDGGIKLVGGQSLYVDGADDISTILGKYIYSERDAQFYRIPSDAKASSSGSQSISISVSTAFLLSAEVSKGDFVEDVFSEEADAYPENGTKDGYWYIYQGVHEESDGKETVIQALTITENGTYAAPAGVDGYSPVTVNVPSSGITPSGTLNITENGTHDVTNYASVNVNVPAGTSLPDGAIAVQMVMAAQASRQIGSGYSLSVTYGSELEINDSVALEFSGSTQTLSNISASTDFSVLLGKYVRTGSSYGSTTGTVYYIPDDATFTVGGQSMSKTLTCDKAQMVTLQKVSL